MSTIIVSAASILVMELACLVPSTLIATLDSVGLPASKELSIQNRFNGLQNREMRSSASSAL